jgi:hypothetical protein
MQSGFPTAVARVRAQVKSLANSGGQNETEVSFVLVVPPSPWPVITPNAPHRLPHTDCPSSGAGTVGQVLPHLVFLHPKRLKLEAHSMQCDEAGEGRDVGTCGRNVMFWLGNLQRWYISVELYADDITILQRISCSVITQDSDHGQLLPTKQKKTPWHLVRKRTVPTERPPLVDEI